jgi:Dyp-type peroxidase family
LGADVSPVDQADVQGNILCGYGRAYESALFLFFVVDDAGALRRWLADRITQIQTAVPWGPAKPPLTLNVAFALDGLRELGLGEAVLDSFPEDFRQGMEERAARIGDTERSAPARWERDLRGAHGVITVSALERTLRDERRRELEAEAASAGFTVTRVQETDVLSGEREPFGFRDGISQPAIKDPNAGPHRRWEDVPVEPGEFVLGYPDEGGSVPPLPREIGMSGSYMVVRKLEQDVDGFWAFVNREAGPERAEWLAAKLVGRWPDGTPLVRAPGGPRPDRAEDLAWLNAFTYRADAAGRACPVGAHIRRAHPRDSLDPDWRFANRHRIIRRGMPYGPDEPGGRPGLLFVCYQASIERQFEFVQSQWCADGNAFGLGSDPDFIAGPAGGKMTIQGDPPLFVPMRSFVTTRGGGYFFAPGIGALRRITGLDGP